MAQELRFNNLIHAMFNQGYCVSPNNIYGLNGVVMYAMGPGVWEPLSSLIINVADKIYIRTYKDEGKGVIAEFNTPGEFVEWCKINGRISEGGCFVDQGIWD